MKTRRPRASLYVRLSEAADDANTSRDGMTADLRSLCEREGFEEVALHVDDGISGAVRDRAEFLAWLADAQEARADVLLAWHADRMTREGLNVAATLLDVVEGKDPTTGRVVRPPVRLMDAKGLDSNDGTAFRFQFVIAAEVARAERDRMRDRMTASLARRRTGRAMGGHRFAGGNVPYGYRSAPHPEGHGTVLTINPEEAEVVRDAATRVLTGESTYAVARLLNARGVPTRRGTSWTVQSLRQVLLGHSIVGRVAVHGEVLTGNEGLPLTVWEPVLALDVWHRLRALRDGDSAAPPRIVARRATATRPERPLRVLSGLVRCAECGAPLYVRTPSAKAPDRQGYACSARSNGRPCPGVFVSADPLEREVEARFLAAFGRRPVLLAEVAEVADVARADLEAAIRETTDAMRAPGADIAALAVRLQSLAARRDTLPAAGATRETRYRPTGQTFAQAWEAADVKGRRALLWQALDTVEVSKGARGAHGLDPSRVVMWYAEGPSVDLDGESLGRRREHVAAG